MNIILLISFGLGVFGQTLFNDLNEDSYIVRLATYNSAGCENEVIDTIHVSLPQEYIVEQLPQTGILNSGENGSINITNSNSDSQYKVTKAGVDIGSTLEGNGSLLSLGTEFTEGNYNIWSIDSFGCNYTIESISFTNNDFPNKLIATATKGTPQTGLNANQTSISLYKDTVDESNTPVAILQDAQLLDASGQVEFPNLTPGNYYLSSSLQNTENYLSPEAYYESAITIDDANPIAYSTGVIYANIQHPYISESEGSNTVFGVVGTQDETKTLTGKEDLAVLVKNINNNEIITAILTNEYGYFNLNNIPDNNNLEIFVSNFAHRNYIPYELNTEEDINYEINFILEENTVYPEGYDNSIEETFTDFIALNIYPNPSKDYIIIDNIDDGSLIKIFDIQGKLVYKAENTNNKINISNFEKGSYIVTVTNSKKQIGTAVLIKE